MSKKKQPKVVRYTTKVVTYVTPKGVEYTLPAGSLCIRVPGQSRQDGSMISNPWCVAVTPQKYLEDKGFIEYGKKFGFIISEDFLGKELPEEKDWHRQFKALVEKEDLGTMYKGQSVPSAAVLQWASETISSKYWETYAPEKIVKIWQEVFHAEHDNEHEFAWDYLVEVEWSLLKELKKAGVEHCFDLALYWKNYLAHDYGFIKYVNMKTQIMHTLFYRRDW
jgi:hypothetical protein